jgi:TonB family protein
MRTILYLDRVRGIPVTGLSVPLRPSTRTIPAAIDARFRGRNVYTTVIPIENLPAYTGDWILWFAEPEAKPGETPLVRAPIPFRKVEPVTDPPPANQAGRRVQVAATLDKNGKLKKVSVVTAPVPGLAEAVMTDVTSWEFKPATRNGVAVEVEVVIEIPFNGPRVLTNNTQP